MGTGGGSDGYAFIDFHTIGKQNTLVFRSETDKEREGVFGGITANKLAMQNVIRQASRRVCSGDIPGRRMLPEQTLP